MAGVVLDGLTSPIAVGIARGAAATTNIGPFGGLNTADSEVMAHHISDDLVTNDDVTSEVTVQTASGFIQLSTTDTTGDFVVLVWKKAV